MLRLTVLSFVAPLFLLLSIGCGDSQPASTLPTVQIQIGRQTFTLEIADTEPTRETGLMYRDSMPANHGMLFVFSDEQPRDFWMKNTRIPLDILFLDHSGKVISSKSMRPLDLTTTSSDGPAKYAIELNQGAVASAGVHVGDIINIPRAAQDRTDKTATSAATSPATAK